VRRSNCLVAALYLVWRLRRYRGVFWVRPSDHIAGWHWGWESRDRRYILHYEPLQPKQHFWAAALHKIWYRGHLKRGDRQT
jgi:hypothetical protein